MASARTPAARSASRLRAAARGLKTTYGRMSLDGVYPLGTEPGHGRPDGARPSPRSRGMPLLEPGFPWPPTPPAPSAGCGSRAPILRSTMPSTPRSGAEVEVDRGAPPGWGEAEQAAVTIVFAEAWANDRHLVETRPDRIGADILERMATGSSHHPRPARGTAYELRTGWRAELALRSEAPVLALPSLRDVAPRLDEPPPTHAATRTRRSTSPAIPPRAAGPAPGRCPPASSWSGRMRARSCCSRPVRASRLPSLVAVDGAGQGERRDRRAARACLGRGRGHRAPRRLDGGRRRHPLPRAPAQRRRHPVRLRHQGRPDPPHR